MSRYLFTDIDGVLNDHKFNEIAQSCTLKKSCVKQFNRILKKWPDIRIVLSSAWRYMIWKNAMTITGFEYMMRTHGVSSNFKIYGITKTDETILRREEQISDYVVKFIGMDKFCILDDLPLSFMTDYYKDRLVRTDGAKGLMTADVDKVIKILQ